MLRGFFSQDLEAVLDFIYNGETNVFQNDLERFLALAEDLQLKGLSHLTQELSGMNAGLSCSNEGLSGNIEELLGTNEIPLCKNEELPDAKEEEVFDTEETTKGIKIERKPIILHTKHFKKNSVDMKTSSAITPKDCEPNQQNTFKKEETAKPQNTLIKEETAQTVEKLYENQNGVWACLQCAYTSKQRGHLREHVEKHIEGLEYSCNHCGKISRSSHTFRDHLRKKH